MIRDQKYRLVKELMQSKDLSKNHACALCGVPLSTFLSWESKRGNLRDRRTSASGRKPAINLTDREVSCLQGWIDRKRGYTVAISFFCYDAACLPVTRAWITHRLEKARAAGRPPTWPASLLRHLKPGASCAPCRAHGAELLYSL